MTFFEELAADARELLEELGEDVIVRRAAAVGGYDPATRRKTDAPGIRQTLRGTFESELTAGSFKDSLTSKYERVCVAIPGFGPASEGEQFFEPAADDRLDGDGQLWRVAEVAPERRQGVPILWIMGLES